MEEALQLTAYFEVTELATEGGVVLILDVADLLLLHLYVGVVDGLPFEGLFPPLGHPGLRDELVGVEGLQTLFALLDVHHLLFLLLLLCFLFFQF